MKALGLISGGLDSLLAAKLIEEQGIEIAGVHFDTGFTRPDRRRVLDALGWIRIAVVDVAPDYLREVVAQPKHGYGAAMNPCIDCRIFMLRRAGAIAEARGAQFVFTGEVLGQSRMAERRDSLRRIEAASGLSGRLLRPLSAGHLPPTEVEARRLVDRSRLGSLHGRSRREQAAMARRFGISNAPRPGAGCCLLARQDYARRLRDLLAHRAAEEVASEDLDLLRVGRHIRLGHDLKVVVARNEEESRFLLDRACGRRIVQVADGHGPVVVVDGEARDADLRTIAALAVRFSRHRDRPSARVRFRQGADEVVLDSEGGPGRGPSAASDGVL